MGAQHGWPRRNRPGRHRRTSGSPAEPLIERVEHQPDAPSRRLPIPAPSPSSLVGIAVLVLIGAGAIHLGSSGSAVPLEEPTPLTSSSDSATSSADGSSADRSSGPGSSSPGTEQSGTEQTQHDQAGAEQPAGERATASQASTLIVHVSGAVESPGVVELVAGARVHDAVEAAGGAEPEADLAAVNLARPVTDGEQIHVPVPGEEPPAAAAPPARPGGAGDDSGPGLTDGSTAGEGPGGTPMIDINTAGVDQLDELPGVGPAIAQRIVEHREANGPFRSVDDLVEVSGIGPATVEKIRPRATAGG